MYVSARQAARILGLGRETTTRVLAAGLAGEPLVTARARQYERARVEELADRSVVTRAEIAAACPRGLVVGRVDPRRTLPSGPWRASRVTMAVLRILAREGGPLPTVTTVGGFVLTGHDLVTVRPGPDPAEATFVLIDPGPWFAALVDRRLNTPPGHHLLVLNCQPLTPRRRTRPRTRVRRTPPLVAAD